MSDRALYELAREVVRSRAYIFLPEQARIVLDAVARSSIVSIEVDDAFVDPDGPRTRVLRVVK